MENPTGKNHRQSWSISIPWPKPCQANQMSYLPLTSRFFTMEYLKSFYRLHYMQMIWASIPWDTKTRCPKTMSRPKVGFTHWLFHQVKFNPIIFSIGMRRSWSYSEFGILSWWQWRTQVWGFGKPLYSLSLIFAEAKRTMVSSINSSTSTCVLH